MATAIKYRVIDKSSNQVMTFSIATGVATYMLGRRLSNYIVIKSSHCDRVVQFTDTAINELVKTMENA